MSVPYSYAPSARRMRPVTVVVAALVGCTALFTVVGLAKAGPDAWSSFTRASFGSGGSLRAVESSVWRGLADSTLNPWYWVFVALLTLLQWFWPARRDERTMSVEMAVDAVWFVMGNALQLTVVATTLGAVTVAYSSIAGGWSLHLQRVFGTPGLAVVAFVLTDGLAWVSHWCHHKIPTLWRFHSVHHSQQRLNALSDNRTHVGEVVAAALIVFVPSQVLGLNASAAMGLAFIGIYYSAMLHSNVRTNLGPLKWVFMGPQPHRVHHSVLPKHYESNFGTVFSWWDLLAGTMYKGYNEYPPTGITDTDFPLRTRGDLNPWRWLVIFVKQLVYPFQVIVAGLRRGRAGAATVARATTPVEHVDPWQRVVHVRRGVGSGPAPSSPGAVSSPSPSPRRTPAAALHAPALSLQGPAGRPPVPTVLPSHRHPTTTASPVREVQRLAPRRPARPSAAPVVLPPPRWYADPVGDGLRFWDGTVWTSHVAPIGAPA